MRHPCGILCSLLAAIALSACQPAESPSSPPEAPAEAPELVFQDARVMDPESGLDAIRHVGIAGGTIVAISETPLETSEVIDASGLVLAPGFIDLHAHGQDAVSNRLQALDGVTTALELEIGVYPVPTGSRLAKAMRSSTTAPRLAIWAPDEAFPRCRHRELGDAQPGAHGPLDVLEFRKREHDRRRADPAERAYAARTR